MINKNKVDYNPGIIIGPARAIRDFKKEHQLSIVRCTDGYILTVDITLRSSKSSCKFLLYTLIGLCIAEKTDRVILIHNHPNNVCRASEEDVKIALSLREELKEYNITLVDSVIVTQDDEYSIAEHNWKYLSSKELTELNKNKMEE